MALQLGDIAPDFTAETTEGPISFHQWLGDSWGVLFSHPKDFTPVCTTELGSMARLKPEFDKRNAKIIGLSVDPVDNHARWAVDIQESHGLRPEFPDDRRHHAGHRQALRHAAGDRRKARAKAGPRRPTRPSARSSSSAPTRRSS